MSHASLSDILSRPIAGQEKRVRLPSQYTYSIRQLQKEYEQGTRRGRNGQKESEKQSSDSMEDQYNCLTTLNCVLPSSKKLRVSVMIKKASGTRKQQKPQKKEKEPATVNAPASSNGLGNNNDLLALFLNAAQELNKEPKQERSDSDSQSPEQGFPNGFNGPKEPTFRPEKDVNGKFMRLYERAEQLVYCFESSPLIEI